MPCVVAFCLCLVSAPAFQDDALRDRVAELVERLQSAESAVRDDAESALVKLGGRALPLLPAALAPGSDDDARARLERIRQKAEPDPTAPARVTIVGSGVRLSDALRQLQTQSRNPITDLRESYGADATNPGLDLDLRDVSFFEALDELARQAKLSVVFYTGDGSVGLMTNTADGPAGGALPPVQYAGPFRVTLKKIGSIRDFMAENTRTNVQFELAWEPRLRPMLLSLRADDMVVVDDRGEPVPPDVSGESLSVVLRPENPAAELNLNLRGPARAAQSLKTVRVTATVSVPAGLKRFVFDRLENAQVKQTNGDVSASLQGVEVDDNVWKVQIRVEMPGKGPVFESYRQGLFNNQVWLQKPDGTRFEQNGGYSTLGASEGTLAFEYLFVDAPGKPADWSLVYETPGRVAAMPLSFTFEDVPLP